MRTIDCPTHHVGVRCNVYEIDTFNLSDTNLLTVPARTYTTQGKPQLQRWETTFPHHSRCEYFHKCLFGLSAPPSPHHHLWRHQLAEIFWPQIFRSCENRRWNFHGARDVDQRGPSEDLARTQCEGNPAHRLLSAGIINAMCRICMQHQARLASSLAPHSPSLRLDIMLGRKFFSQILNCRSGINKREK